MHAVLRQVFGEDAGIKTIPLLNAYIVTYRRRKIAFTAEGQLIAIGCNPEPDEMSLRYDQRVSTAIYAKTQEVGALLQNAGRNRRITI